MKTKSKLLLAGFCLSLFVEAAWAKVDFTAVVYEKGSKQSKKLFTLERSAEDKGSGLIEAKSVFSDLSGAPVLEERSSLNGSALVRVEVDQKQTQQKGSITRVGDQVEFSVTSADGKVKTATEKFAGSLVVPANFTHWVRDHWAELEKGETVEMRFGVWERTETVGFKLFKISEESVEGQKVFVFKMKASSFIIAALVDPIIFKYSDKGERLIALEGRVAPKRAKAGGGWSDLDAEVIYTQAK